MKVLATVKRAKVGTSRQVRTSYGPIEVLEYGIASPEVEPLFVDLHGGGFVVGWAALDDAMCDYFRRQAHVKVISIDYPKAPKYPYPAALEAIYEIIQYYVANADEFGIDVTRIGIGGHSAGGNLATVVSLKAVVAGEDLFKYQILDYPACDLSLGVDDRPEIEGSVPTDMMVMFGACYYNNDPILARDPFLSPVFAPAELLAKMPPALIIVAGKDSLHDEGVRYGEVLKAAGVPVELAEFPDSVHGFTTYNGPDAERGWAVMAEFIKSHTTSRPSNGGSDAAEAAAEPTARGWTDSGIGGA